MATAPSSPNRSPEPPALQPGMTPAATASLVPDLARRADGSGVGHAHAVQHMFDRISPTYDLLNRLLSFGIDQRWRRRALDRLFAGLPEGAVLDLCTGTGDLARDMHGRAAQRPLVAADFSGDMLRAGQHKAANTVELAQADAMRLPFRDAAFAGVVCGFGMRNLSDPVAGMAEVLRTLAPGGRFVVLEFYRPTRVVTHAFHTFYGRMLLPAVGAIVSGDSSAYRYLSRSMLGFMTREAFQEAMTDVGFRDVGGVDLTFGVASLVWGTK